MPCIMPESPYCPACQYGYIVPIGDSDTDVEWHCLLKEDDLRVCSAPIGHWEWSETWSDETPEYPRELVYDGWACSFCGIYLLRYLQSHFHDIPSYAECISGEMPTVERCPHCGAKMMDGGKQDAE